MIGALLTGGVTFRRVASLQHLGLAAGCGLLVGVLVLALPAPELAEVVHRKLVTLLGGALAVPLVAALVTADRRGGYEALAGSRPVSSPAWVAGRRVPQNCPSVGCSSNPSDRPRPLRSSLTTALWDTR